MDGKNIIHCISFNVNCGLAKLLLTRGKALAPKLTPEVDPA